MHRPKAAGRDFDPSARTGRCSPLPNPEKGRLSGWRGAACPVRGEPLSENDSGLIEKVAIDMGAWVKDPRIRGYEKVILVGWSGGGSLSLLYQAEAEAPSITATPAGDAVDLTRAGLEPADGVIFIAAHLSRAETLTEWFDPSVTEELDPDRRDLKFDIYEGASPHQPPYADAFVTRFRAAQIARNRKITPWCQEWLDSYGGEGRARSSAALSSIGRCATCGGSIPALSRRSEAQIRSY
jgi:hypothetical protein